MLDFLSHNKILEALLLNVIAGLVVGVILELYALIRRPILNKSYEYLTYQYNSTILCKKNEITDKEIKYDFDEIKVIQIRRTYIYIWNPNSHMIFGKENSRLVPIEIEFPEKTQILLYNVPRRTPDTNTLSLNKLDNKVTVSFDSIGRRQGIALQILHDSNTNNPKVFSYRNDAKFNLECRGQVLNPMNDGNAISNFSFFLPYILLLFAYITMSEALKIINGELKNYTQVWEVITVALILTVFAVRKLRKRRRQFPYVLAPNVPSLSRIYETSN